MKILISNDDGVYAPGLTVLAAKLEKIAKITVVAPDRNRSGASNSLTLDAPVRAKRLENGFISVEGTPTDCVHLALTGLLDDMPDIVVSGINAGANLSDDVFYSGTVAAAMEGRFLGIPSIAFSLVGTKHYDAAGEIAKQLTLRLYNEPIPAKTILNVNVPDLPLDQLRGFDVTRLGTRHNAGQIHPTKDPRGQTIYWIGLAGSAADSGVGTDFYAINQRKVSITPLQLDLTHYSVCEQLESWTETFDLATDSRKAT